MQSKQPAARSSNKERKTSQCLCIQIKATQTKKMLMICMLCINLTPIEANRIQVCEQTDSLYSICTIIPKFLKHKKTSKIMCLA